MNCTCCGRPMPVLCIECDGPTEFGKSKRSSTGNRYQIRYCDLGHKTIVTHDGKTARRYSSALEGSGFPATGHDKAVRGKGGKLNFVAGGAA